MIFVKKNIKLINKNYQSANLQAMKAISTIIKIDFKILWDNYSGTQKKGPCVKKEPRQFIIIF